MKIHPVGRSLTVENIPVGELAMVPRSDGKVLGVRMNIQSAGGDAPAVFILWSTVPGSRKFYMWHKGVGNLAAFAFGNASVVPTLDPAIIQPRADFTVPPGTLVLTEDRWYVYGAVGDDQAYVPLDGDGILWSAGGSDRVAFPSWKVVVPGADGNIVEIFTVDSSPEKAA